MQQSGRLVHRRDNQLHIDAPGGCPLPSGALPGLIDPRKVKLGKKLGSGAFGMVVAGTYNGKKVAVKTIKGTPTREAIKDFEGEARLLANVPRHKNVAQFVGITESPLMLVTELIDGGALDSRLKPGKPAVPWDDIMRWARDIARGIGHLHSNGILHRDLATRNVLITRGNPSVAKVTDFGLSVRVCAPQGPGLAFKQGEFFRGPYKWMPPEALANNVFSTKTDVWAYGVTLWEIISRRPQPFEHIPDINVVKQQVIQNKLQLPLLARWPTRLNELMLSCWRPSPVDRPEMAGISATLRSIGDSTFNGRPLAAVTDPREFNAPVATRSEMPVDARYKRGAPDDGRGDDDANKRLREGGIDPGEDAPFWRRDVTYVNLIVVTGILTNRFTVVDMIELERVNRFFRDIGARTGVNSTWYHIFVALANKHKLFVVDGRIQTVHEMFPQVPGRPATNWRHMAIAIAAAVAHRWQYPNRPVPAPGVDYPGSNPALDTRVLYVRAPNGDGGILGFNYNPMDGKDTGSHIILVHHYPLDGTPAVSTDHEFFAPLDGVGRGIGYDGEDSATADISQTAQLRRFEVRAPNAFKRIIGIIYDLMQLGFFVVFDDAGRSDERRFIRSEMSPVPTGEPPSLEKGEATTSVAGQLLCENASCEAPVIGDDMPMVMCPEGLCDAVYCSVNCFHASGHHLSDECGVAEDQCSHCGVHIDLECEHAGYPHPAGISKKVRDSKGTGKNARRSKGVVTKR